MAVWCEELTSWKRRWCWAGWGQEEEKGTTEDEMVGWYHWLNGLKFEQAQELVMDREAWHVASTGSQRVGHNWVGTHFHFSLSCIGEGNGNPLQCSCLESPRDGGAWLATVYGVPQSRTWLKRLSSSSSRRWIKKKILLQFMSKCVLYFPVRVLQYSVLHWVFNPFWVYFCISISVCSSFILFHVVVQFSQHNLLKRESFLHY